MLIDRLNDKSQRNDSTPHSLCDSRRGVSPTPNPAARKRDGISAEDPFASG